MEIADVPRCAKSVTIHAKSVTIQDYSLGALRSRQDWQRSIEQVAAMRTMVLSLKSKHCGWWNQSIKFGGSLRHLSWHAKSVTIRTDSEIMRCTPVDHAKISRAR
jgi:hypothetical protein